MGSLRDQNGALTQTNLKLVGTNEELSKELKEEKERNRELLLKLQRMAQTFNDQQHVVQQMVSESTSKVNAEVANEMTKDTEDTVVSAAAAGDVDVTTVAEGQGKSPAPQVDNTQEVVADTQQSEDDNNPDMQEVDQDMTSYQ